MSTHRTLREFKDPFMEIECANCDRRGRYKVSRLIEKWGGEMPIATFIASLGMTCPKYVRASKSERCGIGCQQLIYMFQKVPFTEEFEEQISGEADRPHAGSPRSVEGSPE